MAAVLTPDVPPLAPAAETPRPGQGYWSLVWTQFRKNRIAFVCAWVIGLLFIVAAWAPVLASGYPWVWTEDGVTTYPLIRNLTAPSGSMSVDYMFNYFLFLSLALPLVGVPVWWFSRRRGLLLGVRAARVSKRRLRRSLTVAALIGAVLLALVPFVGPGFYERQPSPEEKKAHPDVEKVAQWHFFRRFRLDRRYYLTRQYSLDRTRGDGALFTFIAQDPIKPTREVLQPVGSYIFYKERFYREMTPAVLTAPNLGGIRLVSFVAPYGGRDGENVRLAGLEGKIICPDLALQQELDTLRPGDPVLWCGKHLTQLNDEGETVGISLLLAGAQLAAAPLPRVWHWLGTDSQGRDVLARLIHGARISMSVGFVAVGLMTLLGIIIGGLAGYYRGWVDVAICRFIELVICFPTFFLIITIIAFVDNRSIFHVMLIMGLTGWPGVARLVRGEFLKLVEQDFVHAGRALGCSGTRLMFRHILPNALGPVLVTVAFSVAGAVLTESSLAFLGFGAPPPTPTWGEMISQGHQHVTEGAWWLFFFPGFLIFLTVTVYNLAGDGLRDAMDPRLRR